MRILSIIGFLILIGSAMTTACWTETNVQGIALDARRLTPDNFQWVLNRYESDFSRGMNLPAPTCIDRSHLIPVIIRESDAAVTALTVDMSYQRAAGILGRLTRIVAELHTIITDISRLKEPDWRTDYAIFLQQNRSFFRIRWKGEAARPRTAHDFEAMLFESTRRMDRVSSILTETLNRENKTIALYDVRSAPFGVGSIAYSSAVNVLAMTWLYIWDRAGGVQSEDRSAGDVSFRFLGSPVTVAMEYPAERAKEPSSSACLIPSDSACSCSARIRPRVKPWGVCTRPIRDRSA